jgi:hypothetical protein
LWQVPIARDHDYKNHSGDGETAKCVEGRKALRGWRYGLLRGFRVFGNRHLMGRRKQLITGRASEIMQKMRGIA